MAATESGFREVVLDQKFDGNWINVSVPPGGGHSTFQGAKFSDFAGGFAYEAYPNSHPALQNRMIYWRTLNDKLELIETSLDFNLLDNQARFVFQDSPIVGPVTIQELDHHIVILVTTVTSVNRIVFTHPLVLNYDKYMKNNAPSIFSQIKNPPVFVLKSFNFAENCHNIPVPTSATSIAIEETQDCVFALSYDTGALSVIRVDKYDRLSNFDLRQSNVFLRMFSGFKQSVFSRNNQPTTDAAIGLSFFTTKSSSGSFSLFLATLSMNGRLRLWQCNNLSTFQDWPTVADVIVENVFVTTTFTDCNMRLRSCKSRETGLPNFVLYMPNRGFKFYVTKYNGDPRASSSLVLEEDFLIDFRERDLIDFVLTNDYLFVLVSNPDEETDWQVKTYKLSERLNSRFNLALLEPLPNLNPEIYPSSYDPRSYYSDLIFNKSSFSISTIHKALGMFPSTCSFERNEKDWDKTREFAMNVVDYEIRMKTDSYEVAVTDEEYYHLSLETWLSFYNSCVEYHILTVKPLGIFFNEALATVGVVKKSRLSFLRPTDYLETLYYFPHCIIEAEEEDVSDEQQPSQVMLVKLMDILELIESTTEDGHRKKLEKQLRRDRTRLMDACVEITQLLTTTDPHAMLLERRHFAPSLEDKLKDSHGATGETLNEAIALISSWNLPPTISESVFDEGGDFSEYFMASRCGANVLYITLKQLVQHRFMIARNLMLLHSLLTSLFSSDEDVVKIRFTLANITDATLAVNNSFLLLQMLERAVETVPDPVIDYGLKIANLLRANTSDHVVRGKIKEATPVKLVEKFCESYLGNAAIRSFVGGAKGSAIITFADAAGRAIWPSENCGTHPFEEFLISHCQYGALHDYSVLMTTYLTPGRRTMQKFYRGLSSLCDGDVNGALVQFKSINAADAMKDSYFLRQILCLPENSDFKLMMFYQKIISLFQIFKEHRAVQELAETALFSSPLVKDRTMMASLAFKSALQVRDFNSAYDFVLRIPAYEDSDNTIEVREKTASIRTLLRALLEEYEIETLLSLDLRPKFSDVSTETVQDKVEEILDAQAQLSDPLASDGVYQMLYVYYIAKEKYYEGALAMYCRAERIGDKGGDLSALEAQRDSLLDVLTCLSCLPNRHQRLQIRKIGAHPIKAGGPLVPGSSMQEDETVRTYDDVVKELNVCIALITLSKVVPAGPVKSGDFYRRAIEVTHNLTVEHHYDAAIKIASQWNLDQSPILVALANTYTKMVHDVRPASGDCQDYIRHNDTSGLPVSNVNATEIALRLLESYVKRLEKPCDSTLHRDVALEILAYSVSLPQWLIDSYKKRNVAQLIHCYLRYGEWKEATELANKVMDAALGRCPDHEFDMTIRKIDIYEPNPMIPYTVIDMLQHQMELRYEIDGDPEKGALLKSLREHISDYCTRVIETRKERAELFSPLTV